MRKITVNVTQNDIDHGIPEDDCECPIAQAIRRALPDNGIIEVDIRDVGEHAGHASVELVLGKFLRQFRLPEQCAEFIALFDAQCFAVAPFSFELEIDECA